MATPPTAPFDNPQKHRRGLRRIVHALSFALEGLLAGWQGVAFRQEVMAAVVLLPLSLYVGQTWSEIALLSGSVLLVLIVELLNSGIETVVDRISHEWHDLSKQAKDLGSAAVLLSLLLCATIWCSALYSRYFS
jgi:diacylglycerol kinase (ATP)